MKKFRNLTSGTFLYWNATPVPSVLKRHLKAIADNGFQCVYLHPMPDDFHKHNFFKGMECSYLGEKYFDLAEIMLEECKKLGLVMMLYDEGGWPSGGVLDRLVKLHPEHRAEFLVRNHDGSLERVKDETPDLFDPRTTETFIQMTHEKYKERFGHEFGKSIRGIFTDEPFFRCRIGTDRVRIAKGMEELAREKFHCDLMKDLVPYIWAEAEGKPETQEARRIYVQICSELFAENYSKVLEKWCRKNHLDLEGHFNREDEYFEVADCGDLLKVLSPLHVPGVDTIWRQIYPGVGNGEFARFASSAAIRSHRKEALCECFNVYSYSLTTPEMHWIANSLLIRGINRILPMPYLYGDQGMRKICCSTDFSPRVPQWEPMKELISFWNVAGQFDTGAMDPDVWVLARAEFPVPNALYPPPQKQKDAGKRAKALLKKLDDAAIVWRFAGYDDLEGERLPKVLVLPSEPVEWEKRSFDRLRKAGVKIVSGWDDSLKKYACVELADGNTVCRVLPCLRPEGEAMMVFNPSDREAEFRFRTSDDWTEIPADPVLKSLYPVAEKDGMVSVRIPAWNLRILLKGTKSVSFPVRFRKKTLSPVWTVVKEEKLSFSAEKPTAYRISRPGVTLPADGLWAEKDFSGKLTLETELDCPEAVSGWLIFDRICHAGELTVNGKKSGMRAFAPWAFPVTLRKGKNRLKLRIFSSAGNEWRRCFHEELEPRKWVNSYPERILRYTIDDAETGIPGKLSLFF